MVVKRQCSFCAAEIEPGTGSMFVKRDGSVFHFCSSSCRKQQLHLGRVGHRLKWTRAHALKRTADRTSSAARRQRGRPTPPASHRPPEPEPESETGPKPKTKARSQPAAPAPSPPPAAEPKPEADAAAASEETTDSPPAKRKTPARRRRPAPKDEPSTSS